MQKKALVIIDIQNDITKNYKDVMAILIKLLIGQSIVIFMLFILGMKTYQTVRGLLNPIRAALN